MKKLLLSLVFLCTLFCLSRVGTADPSFARVGLYNTLAAWVNPATEDGNLATMVTALAALRLSLAPAFTTQTVSLAAAGVGTTLTLSVPMSSFGFQLSPVGGTLVDWDANLQGSMDAKVFTALINQTLSSGIGANKWTSDKPVLFIRQQMVALSLGTATGVNMIMVGK